MEKICALGLPFFGTAVGAAFVFFMRGGMGKRLSHTLMGFAAGIMTAATLFSLLLPAIQSGRILPSSAGLFFGFMLLPAFDRFMPDERKTGKTVILSAAVTLHNLPEGMAVGAALAGLTAATPLVSAAAVTALSLGIAVQNIPEGAIISMPLYAGGMKKRRAFLWGMLSGAAEPLGALSVWLFLGASTPLIPGLLSFAAGAMLYVVLRELVPEMQSEENKTGIYAFLIGFMIMMLLDVLT